MLLTATGDQGTPLALGTPRALSARATPRSVVTPLACISLTAFNAPLAGAFYAFELVSYAVIGMSSMATAVIGGPFTMLFLCLEMTGDFALAPLIVPSVLVSALTARRLFGFSFATWRFHMRGEAIRSAHDVGWIRNLTVGRLMRQDMPTVREDTVLADFRRDHPLGSSDFVVAVDENGRYAGLVPLNRAYALDLDNASACTRLSSLLVHKDAVLLASMNVKEAVAAFEAAEADALVVIDSTTDRHVVGVLAEAHALRRYSEELDQRRRELMGEAWHS